MNDETGSVPVAKRTGEMTQSAKYVFLDVVQFTHNRNVEAQTDIVADLNTVVRDAISHCGIAEDTRLFIPTGDGMCIALLNTEGRYPYDLHICVALRILESLEAHNADEPDEMRRFQVRIGINANEDNLFTDINGGPNLAGAGISLASRIMDKADGGQVLVGESVFERLQQREMYMNKFKDFGFTDKHGTRVRVYQYIENCPGLNTHTPKALEGERRPEMKLTAQMAYYMAYAIKNRHFISKVYKEDSTHSYILPLLLYTLSLDAVESQLASESEARAEILTTWKFREATFEEQFEHYKSIDTIDFSLMMLFADLIKDKIRTQCDYGAMFLIGAGLPLFVSDKGKEKLKQEFAGVWNSWGLA
jgi:class 3 adenylate cyclase